MAVFTTNSAIDMTGFDISDLKTAAVTRTDTLVTAVGAHYTYKLGGTGFGTGSGLPSGGTVTSLAITGSDGTDASLTGFSVSVFSIGIALFSGATFLDIEAMLLGGNDTFNGSTGNDHLLAFGGNDKFNMDNGGDDNVAGMDGNDTFAFGAKLTASDIIDGGTGKDVLKLAGDYSDGVTFSDMTLLNVEQIGLKKGNSYNFTSDDATVASGAKLLVDGSGLKASNSLSFNGGAETDGSFVLKGGAGADTLVGGAKQDTFTGGLGADTMTGGGSKDVFVYTNVLESTGTTHDTIVGFDFKLDKFDLDVTVTGIDANVSGALSDGSFNADLKSAIKASKLGAGHAVEFDATGGSLAGHHFLVVDANGVAGYQSGADYVIELSGAQHVAAIDTTDFI
ncbi:MAG TPA: calcium-binding protein [Rhizomicrobium sp.]|nr:calcium-binding protein [Rhizomicrobium sp.]